MKPYGGGVFQCYEGVVPNRYAGDQPKQEIEAECQLRSRTGYSTEHGVAIVCDNAYQVYKRSLLFRFRFMLTDLFTLLQRRDARSGYYWPANTSITYSNHGQKVHVPAINFSLPIALIFCVSQINVFFNLKYSK